MMKLPGTSMPMRCAARLLCAVPVALTVAAATGCGGAPTAPKQDEVFYLHGAGIIDRNFSYETYFPPLDRALTERTPRMVGVGVLDGDVRLSRPIDWYVRSADYSPQSRFISYQSPRQFLFSIFERIDDPQDPWPDLLRRYEKDLTTQGAQIISGRTPISTANAQGRSYFVRTKVAAKPPYEAFAHEILVRSHHRILLVQVVHQQNIDASVDEMMSALGSMIVY
ncbi:hypothetical protein [Chondromyces apiculatus]|uniref:Lipoprotein n=1 Tax=Chondromyces apiculatus DSM 436 TaxID=1192034 RepID=A0A017T2I5_9BACT|nr:hypothetical protein [Chondromyces apiculatus]EYF03448.1 Hypothetical protein CAP_5555 [Chondromyces apiculatus DSM 436]